MRLVTLLLCSLLLALCTAKRHGWIKRTDDDKEKKDGFANALSHNKKQYKQQQHAPKNSKSTPNFDSMNLMQALGEDYGSLDQQDMLKVLSDSLDAAIDTLSTPSKRRELHRPEVIEDITAQLPEFVLGMPDVQEMLKLLQTGEGKGNEELREQIDAGLDMALEVAQQMRKVIQNPEELPALVGDALDQLGLADEEKQVMLDMMSNPEAMQESMKLMMEQLQSDGMADDLLQNDEFMKLMGDPAELTNKLQEMMQDPEVLAALDDPETARMMQELMGDSNLVNDYTEQLGSKSSNKVQQRRAAMRQQR